MDNPRREVIGNDPPGAVGDPEDLGALADELLGTVSRAMHRARYQMRRHGAVELTVPQFRAMRYISKHPGVGLSTLAEHLGMSTSSASALVERLVKAGMVEREIDPTERRRIRLQSSPNGAEVAARAQLGTRAWLSQELAGLDPGERRALAAALRLIGRIGADRDDGEEAAQ